MTWAGVDDDGYLWLDGRRDDLIISGGVNVYPLEVEQALEGRPGVDEVAVFGVDDERWGQRVCVAYTGTAGPDAVLAHAAAHLAPHKRPKEVHRVDGPAPHPAPGSCGASTSPGCSGLAVSGASDAGVEVAVVVCGDLGLGIAVGGHVGDGLALDLEAGRC